MSFIDGERQWYKSSHGYEINEVPREISFCSHAILDPREPLVINDMSKDPRFLTNPLVTGETHVRFCSNIRARRKTY